MTPRTWFEGAWFLLSFAILRMVVMPNAMELPWVTLASTSAAWFVTAGIVWLWRNYRVRVERRTQP